MAKEELQRMDKSNHSTSTDFKDIKTRTIIARFEIEDNDIIELGLYNSLQCESLKDFTKLPDTDDLYNNDPVFRKLAKERKALKRQYNDYINKTKLK